MGSPDAYVESKGPWWSMKATGHAATYAGLVIAIGLALYFNQLPVPGPLVFVILSTGMLGIRLGMDIAGSQNRRLEAEIGRYSREIDRLTGERNTLQQKFIVKLGSSKREKAK